MPQSYRKGRRKRRGPVPASKSDAGGRSAAALAAAQGAAQLERELNLLRRERALLAERQRETTEGLAHARRERDTIASTLDATKADLQVAQVALQRATETIAELTARLAALQQEVQRQRSAAVAAERAVVRGRQTLSFQLGNALVMAGKSWAGVGALPATLWDLRRQSRLGRFRGRGTRQDDEASAPRRQLLQEVEAVYARDGLAAAEQWLQRHSDVGDGVARASALTKLAKLAFPVDPTAGRRMGLEALRLDPRPFRRKWLGFQLFDVGQIREAHELLACLPVDEPLKPSERHKADRIAGAFRLLSRGPQFALPTPQGPRVSGSGPILYVAASSLPYHVSGYTIRTHGLLTALRRQGHDVVCVTRPGYPEDRSDSLCERVRGAVTLDGVRYEWTSGPHRRKVPPDRYLAAAAEALLPRARALDPRLVHAASNYESAIPALIVARKLGVPFVYEVRGLWEFTAASKRAGWEQSECFALDRTLETFVAQQADLVFTLTRALADELVRRGVERDKIRLTPNGVALEEFQPVPRDTELGRQLGLTPECFVVGYVGSVVGYEGLDDLVSALEVSRRAGIDARVLIVGQGEAIPVLRRQVESQGLGEFVVFAGAVAPSEVRRYYSLMSVVALPRKPLAVCQLVSPLKPLEAMAMRVPVVVSDAAALAEMVTDGVTGLVFPSGNVEALAAQLRRLAQDPELGERLVDAAWAALARGRTWSAVAASVASEYPARSSEERPRGVGVDARYAASPRHPKRRNALSAEEKKALSAMLGAALENGGVQGLRDALHARTTGHSQRFTSFCELRAARACLDAGEVAVANTLVDSALARDRSAGTLRSATRVLTSAAEIDRAESLAVELADALPESAPADQALVADAQGRARLARWAQQTPVHRSRSAHPRRVLNVLAFSFPYATVGYAARSHGLARGILDAGWEIRPYTRPGFPGDFRPDLAGQVLPEEDEIDGVVYGRLLDAQRDGSTETEYLLSSVEAYERVIRLENPALVHAASNYVTALPALVAARRQGVPFVYEVRGFWEVTRSSRDQTFEHTQKFRLMRHFESLVTRHADRVLTITTAMKERLVEHGLSEDRVDISFNGVDPEILVPRPRSPELGLRLGIPQEAPVIGYVGSLLDYEGLDDLVTAAAQLEQAGLDFRLLMVGDGAELESLRTLVRSLGLADRVILPGRVSYQDVGEYYSLIDIAPFPRKPWEVCELVSPLKPFEAMAQEKAVVVSSTRALSEIVTDGENGLVFPKGDAHALAEVLRRLIENRDLRASLGQRAREWVIENRSWRASGRAAVSCYQRALADAHPVARQLTECVR